MEDIVFKKIPWYLKLNPLTWGARIIAQYPKTILLDDKLFQEYQDGKFSLYLLGIIEHEKYHLKRMREVGNLRFRLKYSLLARFRLQEELDADRERFKFLKKNGGKVDLKARAKLLSGPLYLWMISKEKALEHLQNLWDII